MEFHKNLSELGWEEVRNRQQYRLPLVDEWIDIVRMEKGNKVLDIGPGPGVFTLRYAEKIGDNGKVTALEKSSEAIDYLVKSISQTNHNIEVIMGDAEEIDLNKIGPFEIVMLTDILHHTDSPMKVLENMYHSLDSKATRILISEFDPEASGEFGPPLVNRLSKKELIETVREAGFTVISTGKQLFEHYYILMQKI